MTLRINSIDDVPERIRREYESGLKICRDDGLYGFELSDTKTKITFRIIYDNNSTYSDIQVLNYCKTIDAFMKLKNNKHLKNTIIVNMLRSNTFNSCCQ